METNEMKTNDGDETFRKHGTVPSILSLSELSIDFKNDLYNYLASQLNGLYGVAVRKENGCLNDMPCGEAKEHFDRMRDAMKISPVNVTCRVNLLSTNREEVRAKVQDHLNKSLQNGKFLAQANPVLPDVIEIVHLAKNDGDDNKSQVMSIINDEKEDKEDGVSVQSYHWDKRKELGWPMTHRVVICDRLCGEAVLRGSNIFVRGVIVADTHIQEGYQVAIYADIKGVHKNSHTNRNQKVTRGLSLKEYSGQCVFLGFGIAQCSRAAMFKQQSGLAVQMLKTVGPTLPPLNGFFVGQMMLQNLPSTVVAHALQPQPNDVIFDMCCAPGGKTTHLASLINNQGLIVASDKSRSKMLSVRKVFQSVQATCIEPLALDSTKCVINDADHILSHQSVQEILSTATRSSEDGLLNVKKFYPQSFDKILLDPPCSALGLRPKLYVENIGNITQLLKHSEYQKKFIANAVQLLKPGGVLTYSTCTINAAENEEMVQYILDTYSNVMELVPIELSVGQPGLPGVSTLTDRQRHFVRRFDPSHKDDTMGFFVAKFIKTKQN